MAQRRGVAKLLRPISAPCLFRESIWKSASALHTKHSSDYRLASCGPVMLARLRFVPILYRSLPSAMGGPSTWDPAEGRPAATAGLDEARPNRRDRSGVTCFQY